MFDWPWSGIHWASGLCIGAVLAILIKRRQTELFWSVGFGVLVLWEVVEKSSHYFDVHAHQAVAPLKLAVGGFAFAPETAINTLGDLIIGATGLFIGQQVVLYFTRQLKAQRPLVE